MRSTQKRRPELESLESLTMLSGGLAGVHQPPPAGTPVAASFATHSPIVLQGTITAKASVRTHGGLTAANITGTGPLRPTGPLLLSGTINFNSQGQEVSGALILVTPGANKLLASVEQTAPGSNQFQYTINGGTKAFLYANGSGTFTIQPNSGAALSQAITSPHPGRQPLTITFS